MSPLGQTIRGRARIDSTVVATGPTTRSGSLTPLTRRGDIVCLISLKTLCLIGIFVSHVSVMAMFGLTVVSQDCRGTLRLQVKQTRSVSTSRESAQ